MRGDGDAWPTPAPGPNEPTDPLAFFEEALSPHGRWHEHPEHGTVWIPDARTVGADFSPYRSNGRWAVDKRGSWSWLSGYEWGDLPFHFGRWTWLDESAWAWVPGTEFAPAWVVWRTTPVSGGGTTSPRAGVPAAMVGWAPMAPTEKWVGRRPHPSPGTRTLAFWFVDAEHLFDPRVSSFVVGDPTLARGIHELSVILPRHDALAGIGGAMMPPRKGPTVRPELGKSLVRLDPSRALSPASPTFEEARVPDSARPAERIEPIDAARLLPPPLLGMRPAMSPWAKSQGAEGHGDDKKDDRRPVGSAPLDMRRHPFGASPGGLSRQFHHRLVKRCVWTSRGKRCWTHRWPPRWQGR